MKLFRRNTSEERAVDREHEETVNDRMRSVLGRSIAQDDAELVEQRIRNMSYGTNKR